MGNVDKVVAVIVTLVTMEKEEGATRSATAAPYWDAMGGFVWGSLNKVKAISNLSWSSREMYVKNIYIGRL